MLVCGDMKNGQRGRDTNMAFGELLASCILYPLTSYICLELYQISNSIETMRLEIYSRFFPFIRSNVDLFSLCEMLVGFS